MRCTSESWNWDHDGLRACTLGEEFVCRDGAVVDAGFFRICLYAGESSGGPSGAALYKVMCDGDGDEGETEQVWNR